MAVKTVAPGGGNWNVASTWSPSGVPSATADNVVFTTTSGPLVISATATIENINFSNYQNTVTFNWPLQVTGPFNFGTQSYTMSFDSTLDASGRPRGRIRHTDTTTITTNNRPWQTPWQWYGTSETITLSGNLTFEEDLYLSHTGTFTINSGNIITKKNVIVDSAAGITTGNATFSMEPITATWSSTGGSIRNNLRLEPSNTLFFGPDVYYGGRRLTTVNSNIGQTNSTLHIESTCTLDISNIYWNDVKCDNTATITLASDLYIKGKLQIANTTIVITGNPTGSVKFQDESSNIVGDLWIYPTVAALTHTLGYNYTVRDLMVGGGAFNTTINSNTIDIKRNLIFLQIDSAANLTSVIVSGTTLFKLSGTGCLVSKSLYTGTFGDPTDLYSVVRNNITIDTTGTIFFGALLYQTGTFQKVSGNFQNGATFSNNPIHNPSSPVVEAISTSGGLAYFFGHMIINNNAAVVNIPGHEWDTYQIGHRYQDPASITRTLTENIICGYFVVGAVATVTINGNFKIYTALGFVVGNSWSSYGGALTIVVNGTSEIYCGLSGSVSSSNMTIGTHNYQAFDSFFDFMPVNPTSTSKVSLPVTINTTGTVTISSLTTGDGGFYDEFDNIFRFGGSTFSVINGKFNTQSTRGFYIDSSCGISSSSTYSFANTYILATGSSPTVVNINIPINQETFNVEECFLVPNQTYTTVTIPGIGAYPVSQNLAYIDVRMSFFSQSVYSPKVQLPYFGLINFFGGGSSNHKFYCDILNFYAPDPISVASDLIVQGKFIISKTFSFNSNSQFQSTIALIGATWYQHPGKIGFKDSVTLTGGEDSFDLTSYNNNSTAKIVGDIYNYGEIRHLAGQLDTSQLNNYYMYGSGIWNYSTDYFTSSPNLTFSNLHITGVSDKYFLIDESLYIQNLYIGSNRDFNFQNNATGSFYVDNFYFGTQSQKISIRNERISIYVNDYLGSTYSLSNAEDRVTLTSTYSSSTATASRYVNFVVSQNATQDLHFVDANYIDSSQGATVWTYKGNITNSRNWNQLPTQPRTIFTSFSS